MTDLLGWFNPMRWLLLGAFVLAVVGGGTILVHRYNEGLREEGRSEIRKADKAAAEEQTERNRELQRAAEVRYTVKAETRDRFITKTITEVRHATESLAACPVPVDAVRLLNAARDCAGTDSPAACGAGDQVPATR